MGKAIMGCAAVSADGYIADDDGQIGSLFDWMSSGRLMGNDENVIARFRYAIPAVRLIEEFPPAQGKRVTHLL